MLNKKNLSLKVFKHLVPGVLMLTGANNSASTAQTIPKDLLAIRDQSVNFVW